MRTPTTLLTLAALLALPSLAYAQETQRLFLSGHDKADAVDWDFSISAGNNANKPSKIKVPSNWELQNFGTFSYGREIPRGQSPGQITGHYKHTFALPASFANQRVFLVFDGSMTDTTVRINGKSAGPTHQGGYYRFKYDITSLLQPGENTLEADVDQESANPSVNNAERRADYWNFAGIFRPVYLEALPQDCITQVSINATADGKFTAALSGFNTADNFQIETQILDAAGQTVSSPNTNAFTKALSKDLGRWNGNISLTLPNPKTWSAETPNMYALQLTLKDQSGKTLHTLKQPFGFRTIETKNIDPASPSAPAGLFVNGQRVMLKGADRHSFWPDSGRCLSLADMKADIAIMKQMNMNAVRCSHYPPDAAFLDLCDQEGMYVLDELAGWHAKYDDDAGHKLTKEMVERDVNHPSILFWDNGNEGGWNNNLNDDFAQYDPQKRSVLHPWELFRGIDTKHYPSYSLLTQRLAAPNVYFPTEMIHGLFDGGAGASLEDYFNAMLASKVSAGGFIWALVDETVKRPDTGQMDTRGNQAPDGILGPYREKEGSFYTVKQLWSPLMLSVKSSAVLPETAPLPENFDGTLQLENRYSFTNANQCSFQWELRTFTTPTEKGANDTGYKIAAKGAAKADLAPNSKGTLKLDLPAAWKSADALAVRANDPAGNELWTFVYPTEHLQQTLAVGGRGVIVRIFDNNAPLPAGSAPPITTTENETSLTVATTTTIFSFDKKTGRISAAKDAKGSLSNLSNGPRLVATGDLPESTLTSFTHTKDNFSESITALYDGPLKSIKYVVFASGQLSCDVAYSLTGNHDYFGLGFDLPEKAPDNSPNVKSFRWLGNGPYRAWKNRIAGGSLNVWQTAYNDTVTGYSGFQYPEFKGYYANVKWAQLQTAAGPITLSLNDDANFLQLLTPTQTEPALQGKTGVKFPSAGLSILHAIPPIGSKFNGPETGGPSGQPTSATGDYHASFSLFFGTP
jgi:hypothetical protein